MSGDYKFTARDKREEAEREVAYRKRVFQRLVAQGKITYETARRRTACMQEMARDYAKLEEGERLI